MFNLSPGNGDDSRRYCNKKNIWVAIWIFRLTELLDWTSWPWTILRQKQLGLWRIWPNHLRKQPLEENSLPFGSLCEPSGKAAGQKREMAFFCCALCKEFFTFGGSDSENPHVSTQKANKSKDQFASTAQSSSRKVPARADPLESQALGPSKKEENSTCRFPKAQPNRGG